MSDDPLRDKRFPDRPQSQDFWRMSEVILRIDGASDEGGQRVEDILGVDMAALMYVIAERIKMVHDKLPPQYREAALYMDAFALGKGFAEAGGHRDG